MVDPRKRIAEDKNRGKAKLPNVPSRNWRTEEIELAMRQKGVELRSLGHATAVLGYDAQRAEKMIREAHIQNGASAEAAERMIKEEMETYFKTLGITGKKIRR